MGMERKAAPKSWFWARETEWTAWEPVFILHSFPDHWLSFTGVNTDDIPDFSKSSQSESHKADNSLECKGGWMHKPRES